MKKIFFVFLFFIFTTQTFSQSVVKISGCPYNFTKDSQYGENGKDIYILQQILNSDKRTIIASAGVGSPGMESSYFGKGTREALKRFQALFIEYIGIADGKFSGRTREMLQSVCNGKSINPQENTMKGEVLPKQQNSETSSSQNISTPKIPLQIRLSTTANSVTMNSSIKIILSANKEIKPITPDIFIVDGGNVKEVHKLSKTEYSAIVEPSENSKKISIQVEADRIEDIDGMTNENASNEITFSASGNTAPTASSTSQATNANSWQNSLDTMLAGLTASLPNTNSSQFISPSPSSPTSSPNSSVPNSSGSSPSQGGSSGNSGFSQMLSSLLGGFAKGAAQQQAQQQAQQNSGMDNGGWNQSQNVDENLAEFDIPADINPACRANYGIDPGGSCPDTVHLTQLVKKTAMQACTVIKGKRITSQSQYRNPSCNKRVGGAQASSHMSGMALDINVNNLSSTERQAVFMVFKKNGFNNIGCYRQGSGNVHLDHRGGGPRRWGPSYSRDSYNPSNCPKELLQVFGN